MQIQTEAIVLRSTKFSESDLILNLYTKKFGKIGVFAKNAKRLKSPLMSSGQLFAYANMMLSTYDGKYKLLSSDLIDNNYGISSSIEKTYLGYYFLQFVEKATIEESTNIRLFQLLKDSLFNLKINENLILQKIIFDIKIVEIFGYKPNVGSCVSCLSTIELGNYFNISDGGRVCSNCAPKETEELIRLDSTSFRLIQFIQNNKYEKIKEIIVNQSILIEINQLMDRYIDYHFDNLEISTRKMLLL